MCLLTEAIKLKDGKLFNLDLHSERMNKARYDLFGINADVDLQKLLVIPANALNDLYKCRITYGKEINSIEWIKYKPREIKSLRLVRCDTIDYSHKYNDRRIFENLLKDSGCGENDAIIIIKNDRLTDTYFSNIVLFNGAEWHTPARPLLMGTKRAELLRKGVVIEKDILENDLYNYESIRLINAMIEFETAPVFLVKDILPPE
jgi:4-amino-4-deoxychorismate lyase